jgi:hypothetical protein
LTWGCHLPRAPIRPIYWDHIEFATVNDSINANPTQMDEFGFVANQSRTRSGPGLGRLVHRLGHLHGADAGGGPTALVSGVEGDEDSAIRRGEEDELSVESGDLSGFGDLDGPRARVDRRIPSQAPRGVGGGRHANA